MCSLGSPDEQKFLVHFVWHELLAEHSFTAWTVEFTGWKYNKVKTNGDSLARSSPRTKSRNKASPMDGEHASTVEGKCW